MNQRVVQSHGAGSLNNNFPGHFCVHFYGSTTDLTDKMDLSHKLMIYKAAGKLEDFINRGEPVDIVKALVTGIKQQGANIMKNTSIIILPLKKRIGIKLMMK
ncbi:hypothetical protein [Pseudogracilibacillus sp. SO30301A]|uniref:hypothetical protein n=1 Tax=Pseudogracilibacillus sp. SO30301A TaxID=3098291 RepID=UPI00300E2096